MGRTWPEFHGLIGHSPAMAALFSSVERFAPHARATLVTGETGSGKATLARVLHQLGPCRDGEWMPIQCAALPRSAMEPASGRRLPAHWAALAGHEGAATEAGQTTLFFDEVADLPMLVQSVLVHALETDDAAAASRTACDVRVVAATSRDLRVEIAAGRFRPELYYRLSVFELHLPPLRDRLDDLVDLAEAFLSQISQRLGRSTPGLTFGAKRMLQALPWPGNLRELRNVLERATLLAEGGLIGEGTIRTALASANQLPAPTCEDDRAEQSPRLDDAQRSHVRAVLESVHGNKSLAASRLGISRRALYRLLDKLAA